MHQFKTGLLALVLSLTFSLTAFSQELISPYSAYGMGTISERGFVSNNGMGNAGLAYGSPWFIPVLNPALLGSQTFSAFEAGLSITQNNISDDVTRYTQVNGGLRYVALAFPIIQGKYGISVALRPFSSKNYNIVKTATENGAPQAKRTSFQGEGTVSHFSISNGWNINKFIAVGLEANYNFGTLTDKTIYEDIIHNSDTINIPYLVTSQNADNISDFSFVFGTKLTKKLGENYLSFGATYDFQANLNTNRNTFLQLTTASGQALDQGNNPDSLNFRTFNQAGQTVIPAKISGGLSYWRANKWVVSADVSYQDWSTYRSFGQEDNAFGEQLKLNFGGEFTPNIQNGTRYYERVTYRAGLNISNGPLVINNNDINSFGITFGSTLPINKVSNINFAFEIGQRGTLLDNLVRENYFNFSLSFTYNDRWFLKRQFD